MSKSKFIINGIAKIFEQSLVTYKDLSKEIMNIINSKRDEFIFKMKIVSKEDYEILQKRVENLEKSISVKKSKKIKKVKRPSPTLDFESPLPLFIL